MNLCTNAVHAMQQGGVVSVQLDVVAVMQPRVFAHGMLQPGDHVRLVVSDTGTGIPRWVQERIFEPFFTTKGTGKGTGLGLSLVQGIVADWQGAIELVSNEGSGTTFTVWLPTCGETAPPCVEDTSELPQGRGEVVMIVDDEAALVRLAEETLAELCYEPVGFHSSRAALEAFAAEPGCYDLVLTDETMPDLTGSQLAREIRKLRPDVPVMLMSGYRGAQLSACAQAAGVDGVLHKPLLSRDIAESLARALARIG
jgi:CheY-like chemotaxis protein